MVIRDPRGGHNRKKVNESFFKHWSPKMTYVLGLICADGAVEDVRNSSRTCYIQITSVYKHFLEQVRDCMGSTHTLSVSIAKEVNIRGKKYWRSECYGLRIGNKVVFQDLVNLGVTPRKSLRLKLPPVPDEYFSYFVRGYFDGDGCVNVYKNKDLNRFRIKIIFTSGCRDFLKKLSLRLSLLAGVTIKAIGYNSNAYRLTFNGSEALGIASFMYKNLGESLFLDRKYQIYSKYLSLV